MALAAEHLWGILPLTYDLDATIKNRSTSDVTLPKGSRFSYLPDSSPRLNAARKDHGSFTKPWPGPGNTRANAKMGK